MIRYVEYEDKADWYALDHHLPEVCHRLRQIMVDNN